MERETYKAAIEGILFAMGQSVELTRLANVLELTKEQVRKIVREMKEEYEKENRGIQILELEDAVQLSTKPQLYEYLIQLAKQPRQQVLTDVLMETLSIVAYKQPVTKAEIEKIRGVSCEHAVNKLMDYGLICELGRLDAPGRPILLGPTEEFLRSFGVRSVEDLPILNPDQLEEFKLQAEEEMQLKLPILWIKRE